MNAQIFSVLAEPNRLNIIELLSVTPRSVNEIVGRLSLNQPQVSKHLKVLADIGIVEVHPLKNRRIYALKPDPFKEIDKWLEKYRQHLEVSFNRLEKLLIREENKL